jgi:hypothetical protein
VSLTYKRQEPRSGRLPHASDGSDHPKVLMSRTKSLLSNEHTAYTEKLTRPHSTAQRFLHHLHTQIALLSSGDLVREETGGDWVDLH